MAATTWGPLTRFEPESWLLANGEILQEPPLETTASGRKIRVAGTTDSVFSGDLSNLLTRAAEQLASDRGSRIWLKNNDHLHEGNLHAARVSRERSRLHLISPTAEMTTQCWWRFKDPKGPFEALLVVSMTGIGYQLRIESRVVAPFRAWGIYGYINQSVASCHEADELIMASLRGTDDYHRWFEFWRDQRPNWPSLGNNTYATPRQAVKALLDLVRQVEDLATLQMPRLSHPEECPQYVDLDIYDSNVNAEFLSELTEYLDSAPTVERAAGIYQELLQALQGAGIQINSNKTENDFLAALLAGERKSLNVPVAYLADEGESRDGNHRLSIHLPSGTFIVECDHKDRDRNSIAEKWEEAKAMASLTGEEDMLLGYAKAYSESQSKGRTERILRERT